jgi:anion-transporting  ArsA/GET3 family ATPase
LRLALRPWFDKGGRLRAAAHFGPLGRGVEKLLDRVVGLTLLRDMAEFFQAFGPLYAGFRERALEVQKLLRSPRTSFVLVSGPGEERIPDTMFFARKLSEAGHHLGPVIVNRIHPQIEEPAAGEEPEPLRLLRWLGRRDAAGVEAIRALRPGERLVALPMLHRAPTDLESLAELGRMLSEELS